jgi:hypothetical protein
MKRLSDEEYDPDTETGQAPESEQPTDEGPVTTYVSDDDPQASGEGDAGSSLLPSGLSSVEGEIPDSMFQEAEAEAAGETPTPDEEGNKEGAEAEAQEGEEGQEEQAAEEEDAEDEDTSPQQGWVDELTRKTGLDAESEDEAIETVRNMQRDLRGFDQFSNVLEQVPQAAQLMHSLAETEGEIDPVDFYMAAQDVEGIDVQAPDKMENPDEWADFKARLNSRQKDMKERRQKRQEQQRKRQQVKQDFQQAFESFKKRKGLSDEEGKEFKQRFAKTFYGDAEKGELPRMDVFDLAYEALNGRQEDDTPVEETEAYQQGYNRAVEELKEGGADGLPDLKGASGTGKSDGGEQSSQQVPGILGAEANDAGMDHSSF